MRHWLLAARPRTLTTALAPVLVGTAVAYAHGAAQPLVAAAALLVAMLIQIGTNLANDYYDFVKGADTHERLGPTRVTQAGLIAPNTVRNAMFVVFALAFIPGAWLVAIGGWPIVAIGVASVISGIAYTGGPWPLGYNGLGDLFVFVFFGLVATMATAFLQLGYWPHEAFVASIPIGAIATAVIVVNNLRDADTDIAAGKRTLAVRFGKRFARAEYVTLLVAAYMTLVPLVLLRGSAWPLLALLSLPLAIAQTRGVLREAGRALNARLAGTAQLVAVFGALLAIGIALGSP